MKTINPSKQRKRLYNAPLHNKRKLISSHLEENLLLKYDKRAVPVVKGDTVRVMRGSFKGHEDKVVKVLTKKSIIEIEGITMSKADGNKIAKPINPSNVIITKLNLTDKWRRMKLERGLSEETRKEIEKEAEEQLREAEEEQKRLEAEKKKLDEEAEKEEEIISEEPMEKEIKEHEEKEKTEKKPKTLPKEKKPVKKKTPGKKTTQSQKKTTPKKTAKKKEEK
jgi:large subunit ribosomal protein L24